MFDTAETPTYHHTDGEKCGHLFAAVITQASHDIFAPHSTSKAERENAQHESIRLLTAKSGEWRAHRNFICTAVGLDGDHLAQEVRNMLLGIRDVRVRVPRKEFDNQPSGIEAFKPEQIAKARAMYAHMQPKPQKRWSSKTPKIVKPEPLPDPFKPSAVLDEWLENMAAE